MGGTVTCYFVRHIISSGVPREQCATALEYVAQMLRKHPEGDIEAVYDVDGKSWTYELIQKSERREFV